MATAIAMECGAMDESIVIGIVYQGVRSTIYCGLQKPSMNGLHKSILVDTVCTIYCGGPWIAHLVRSTLAIDTHPAKSIVAGNRYSLDVYSDPRSLSRLPPPPLPTTVAPTLLSQQEFSTFFPRPLASNCACPRYEALSAVDVTRK